MIVDYNNYIDQIKQEFPELSKKSIKDILKHGFKNYIRFNASGADVLVRDTKVNKIVAYCGKHKKTNQEFFIYNKRKQCIKNKIQCDMQNNIFEGFYYFGLNEDIGRKFKINLKKTGDYINIYKTYFGYSLDDVKNNESHKYIFKLNYPLNVGFSFYKDKFKVLKKDVEFYEMIE